MPLSEERRSLGKRDGRPGFEVTALGLGCGTIAGVPSDADALSAVTTAVDIGFGFFDTAPWYGRTRSERRLGVALSNYPRDQYFLQTKVGRFTKPVRTERLVLLRVVPDKHRELTPSPFTGNPERPDLDGRAHRAVPGARRGESRRGLRDGA